MATGDLKGCLRKLQTSLRSLKYPRDVDYQRLAKGDPFCCLPILSYAFTSFSPALAEHLVESGIELTGKNDLNFTESLYKVLRDLFSYKPLLNRQQFLQFGFAERKITLLCDVIGLVLTKHTQLTKGKALRQPKRRLSSRSESTASESPASPDTHRIAAQRSLSHSDSKMPKSPASLGKHRIPAQRSLSCGDPKTSKSPASPGKHRIPAQRWLCHRDPKTSKSPASPDTHRIPVVLSRPLVEKHSGSSSAARAGLSPDRWPEQKRLGQDEENEEEGRELSAGDSPRPAVHTCTLRAVETALRECVSRMDQLDARLQALERRKMMEHSHWENLESRVLLLETSLALASAQGPVKAGGVVSLPASGEESHLTEETDLKSGPGSSPAVGWSASEPSSAIHPPTGLPSASPEETIKERLERIANMMKDTSSLLKTT